MGTQRRNTAVFAVLALVLMVVTGLFVILYAVARDAAGEAHDELTAVEQELADTRAHVRQVRADVANLHDEHDELRRTNDRLRACAEPTKEGIAAAARHDDAGLSAAIEQMLTRCVR